MVKIRTSAERFSNVIPTEKGPSSLDTYNIINYAVCGNIHITWWSIIILFYFCVGFL